MEEKQAFFAKKLRKGQTSCKSEAIGKHFWRIVNGTIEYSIDGGAASAHWGVEGTHIVERLLDGGYLGVCAEHIGLEIVGYDITPKVDRGVLY